MKRVIPGQFLPEMPVDQCDDGTELGKLLCRQHVLFQQPYLIDRITVELRDQYPVHLTNRQEIETLGGLAVPHVRRDNDGGGVYGSRFGLSEQPAHILDDLRIGLDKVQQFLVGGSLFK